MGLHACQLLHQQYIQQAGARCRARQATHLHLGQGSGRRGKGLRAQRSRLLLQAHALAALRCSSSDPPSEQPGKHSSYTFA